MVWKGEPFRLVKKKPPTGAKRIGWRRYVIAQGKKIITGHRQGSLEGVTVAVEEILVQLNERRRHKPVRVQLGALRL